MVNSSLKNTPANLAVPKPKLTRACCSLISWLSSRFLKTGFSLGKSTKTCSLRWGSLRWGLRFPVVITHEQRLAEEFMKKSRDKLRELQGILGKIGSLRNGRGGDLFFKGLMKSFQVNPVIPPSNYYQDFDPPEQVSDYQENEEMLNPKFQVKTKFYGSVGGGGSHIMA